MSNTPPSEDNPEDRVSFLSELERNKLESVTGASEERRFKTMGSDSNINADEINRSTNVLSKSNTSAPSTR